MKSWVGTINLIFWSGFSILKSTKDVYGAGSVAVSKHVTHYDPLSGLLYYNLTALHPDSSYPPPRNVLISSVCLSPGYLHQSYNLNSSYMIMSCLINILYFLWKLNIFWYEIIIYKVLLWNHWTKLNLLGKKRLEGSSCDPCQ